MTTRFSLRAYRRADAAHPSYYLTEWSIGKAILLNVSVGGLKMETEHRLEPGTRLSLRVVSAKNDGPLDVDVGIVRWARGRTCGVKVLKMSGTAGERWNSLVGERLHIDDSKSRQASFKSST